MSNEGSKLSRRDVLFAAGGIAGLGAVAEVMTPSATACAAQPKPQRKPRVLGPGKLLVIHDKNGRIISAMRMTQPAPKGFRGPPPKIGATGPKPHHKHNEKRGYSGAELDIPATLHDIPAHKLLDELHVDVAAKKLVPKKK